VFLPETGNNGNEGGILMQVCNTDMCNGCGLCLEICGKNAIHIVDNIVALNAEIDLNKCISCNLCHHLCPRNQNGEIGTFPMLWKQGWSNNDEIRMNASSGGVISDIIRGFIGNGGKVATCTFNSGEFKYQLFESVSEMIYVAGSKYVKSSPHGIYKLIRSELDNKTRILFIGLPCHVAAIREFVKGNHEDLLYTIDLVCHGSPSPKILEHYLTEYGIELKSLIDIRFRSKIRTLPSGYHYLRDPSLIDYYLYAFLGRYINTENCYHCPYAQIKRVGDLTVGDSWGSELDVNQTTKGISLILCQTMKGKELLGISTLSLHDVDLDKAVKSNAQLQKPSEQPLNRAQILSELCKGVSLRKVMLHINPKVVFKQMVKETLLRLRLIQPYESGIVYCVSYKKNIE